MNYGAIYDRLIYRAKSENRIKLGKSHGCYVYYERHHIIPKCCGGNNSKDNLVLLTAREHFISHKLLVEIYPNKQGLKFALHRMTFTRGRSNKRNYHISSHEYERIRIICSNELSKIHKGKKNSLETRLKISKSNKGKIISTEQRLKISISNSGKVRSEEEKLYLSKINLGRKHSEKTKEILRIKGHKRKHSDETISKMKTIRSGENNPFFGHSHSEKSKKKMSIAWDNVELVSCPYCGKEGKQNMKRYHFENCKYKN